MLLDVSGLLCQRRGRDHGGEEVLLLRSKLCWSWSDYESCLRSLSISWVSIRLGFVHNGSGLLVFGERKEMVSDWSLVWGIRSGFLYVRKVENERGVSRRIFVEFLSWDISVCEEMENVERRRIIALWRGGFL